jgi:AAHS family 4-hydroxybenzoate transporter-like MFS transporter
MERDLRGMTIGGRYRIERLLARGGMGTTYIAVDERAFERRVVIKVPDALRSDDARARFVNEARQIIGLQHPHIVTALDVGTVDTDDTTPFIAMAYMGGGDLGQRIAASGGVQSPDEVARWLGDIADALDLVHERQVLHRDVKPGNILFDRQGPNAEPFLADFGIAKALEGEVMVHTHTGEHLGSPKYMPPETWFGTPGPTFDQYSLACVAYEALSGTLPHTADNALALAMEKNAKPARPLAEVAPHVPGAAAAALMRGLEKDPAQRFRSCGELARAFVAGLTTSTNQARTEQSAEPAGAEYARAQQPPPPAGGVHTSGRQAGRPAPGTATSVDDSRDARPRTALPMRVLTLSAAVLFVVGFDTQLFGSVASALSNDLGLDRASLSLLFSSGQAGLVLGALLLGPLADRQGRKRVIVLSTIVFGVCTLVTFAARDGSSLIALRFLTGLGLGGAIPSALALTAEASPDRRGVAIVMATFCGLSIGAAAGGVIGAVLLQMFGWPSVFLFGGVLPLLLAPLLAISLPESAPFLALRGSADHSVNGTGIARVFSSGPPALTLWLWAILFLNVIALSVFLGGLSVVLVQSQEGSGASVAIQGLVSIGGVLGALALGPLIDRRSFAPLGVTYLGGALVVAAIGFANGSTFVLAVATFCAGISLVGGEIAVTALAANYYSTPIRATGVGWAVGMGRLGLFAAPFVGSLLSRGGPALLFLGAAVLVVGASLAAFGISRVTAAAPQTESRSVGVGR